MLTFNEALHEYRWGNTVVPGVTTVLKPLYEWLGGIPDKVLERKGAIGRETHKACELIDQNDLDSSSLDPAVVPYVDSYLGWLHATKPQILANEARVFHLVHRYAGTLDRRMLIDGQKWHIDLKTTSALSPAVGVQLAAYQAADEGHQDTRRGALQLLPDGSPARLVEYKSPDDWPVFLSLLNLWRWRKNHGAH